MTYGSTFGLNLGSYSGDGYYQLGGSGSTYLRTVNKTDLTRAQNYCASAYTDKYLSVKNYADIGDVDTALDIYKSAYLSSLDNTSIFKGKEAGSNEYGSVFSAGYNQAIGENLTASLYKKTSSSLMTGLKSSIPLVGFFTPDTSKAEVLSTLSGVETPQKEGIKKSIGTVLGNIAFVAGGIATAAAFTNPIGIAAGALMAVGSILTPMIKSSFKSPTSSEVISC